MKLSRMTTSVLSAAVAAMSVAALAAAPAEAADKPVKWKMAATFSSSLPQLGTLHRKGLGKQGFEDQTCRLGFRLAGRQNGKERIEQNRRRLRPAMGLRATIAQCSQSFGRKEHRPGYSLLKRQRTCVMQFDGGATFQKQRIRPFEHLCLRHISGPRKD